jgi:hypothetical protein
MKVVGESRRAGTRNVAEDFIGRRYPYQWGSHAC